MRLPTFALCLICVIFSFPSPQITFASDERDQAAFLVRKLGSLSFMEREAAHKELMLFGSMALPALHDGLKSNDLEVKQRCKQLIPTIEQAEWAQKADAYETDRKGEQQCALPLQKEYEKLMGTDPFARRLFAEILRTNGAFLQRIVDATDGRQKVYERRCRELLPSLNATKELDSTKEQVGKLRHGDLAVLLLVAAIFKVDQPISYRERNHLADLLGNAGVGEAVKDQKIGKAFSLLLVVWVQSQRLSSSTLEYFLHFVYTEKFKEGLVVVRQMIHAKGHNEPWPHIRAVGVKVLAEFGDKEVTDELEKLCKDQRILFHTPDKDPVEIRLGDQALAASMLRAGANPRDFRMVEFPTSVLTPPGMDLWTVPLYGFVSDSDRRKTVKEWEQKKGREQNRNGVEQKRD